MEIGDLTLEQAESIVRLRAAIGTRRKQDGKEVVVIASDEEGEAPDEERVGIRAH